VIGTGLYGHVQFSNKIIPDRMIIDAIVSLDTNTLLFPAVNVCNTGRRDVPRITLHIGPVEHLERDITVDLLQA